MRDGVSNPSSRMVKPMTPIRLERNISKMAGDRASVPKDDPYSTSHSPWGINWSRDRCRHVTPMVLWCSTIGYPSDSLASCCCRRQQENGKETKGKERYRKSQDISAICGAEIPEPILIEFGVRVAPHEVGLIKMSNVCNKIFMSFRSTGDQN